jgi:hypothetical protein
MGYDHPKKAIGAHRGGGTGADDALLAAAGLDAGARAGGAGEGHGEDRKEPMSVAGGLMKGVVSLETNRDSPVTPESEWRNKNVMQK